MSIIHVDFQKRMIVNKEIEAHFESDTVGPIYKPVATNWYAEIKESVEARFGSTLPNHFKACMKKPQAQPYLHGDCHNVQYGIKKPNNFNRPMPVPCEVTTESCARVGGELALGSKCHLGVDEAFQWIDSKYHCTLNFLKSLPVGTRILINTRSDLVAHDDYVHELKRLRATLFMFYASEDDELNRRNEPGAPSYKRRLQAVEKLIEEGVNASMLKQHIKKTNKRESA